MRSLKELMDLKGRVALVTGGAGHIGSTLGRALAGQGARVVVLDLTDELCRFAAEGITQASGLEAVPLAVDLADQDQIRSVPDRIRDRLGRLDILVNCAALVGTSDLQGWAAPLAEQSARTWRKALEVNLTAPFVLIQACVPLLAASGHGSVINVASIYGLLGPDQRLYEGTSMGNPAAYSASKGGLLALTRWLATVLAPGIRVNALTLGGVERGQPEVFQERYRSRTPLGRMATEEDFIGAGAFLASDLSAYVTGQNIVVDGGWTAW